MKTLDSNEFILLRIPPIEENISFIFQTFGIVQYVFFDERFATCEIIKKDNTKFDKDFYNQFREKCLAIENHKEIAFTINEFLFLSRLIDFVSKCFIGNPNETLKKIIESDFIEKQDFEYNKFRKWYLEKASLFFKNFKLTCSNKELIKKLENLLEWKIEI